MAIKPGKPKHKRGGHARGVRRPEGGFRPARFSKDKKRPARKEAAAGEGKARALRRQLKGRPLNARLRKGHAGSRGRSGPTVCPENAIAPEARPEPPRPERKAEVPDQKPKRGPQPLELDRAYTAAQIGILRVTYAALARTALAASLQKLQALLRASGGQALVRAFSRVDPSDRDYWVIWEDSATGSCYFTSEGRQEVEIPFELPAGWFRAEGRVLKWRTEEADGGRTLCVLRHRAMAPEVRSLSAADAAALPAEETRETEQVPESLEGPETPHS